MRARSKWTVVLSVLLPCAACGTDGLLQGDEYVPNGTLPIAPASNRLDAGRACDGDASCDASAPDGGPTKTVPPGATPPSNTCQTARDIGTLSGDTGAQTLTTTGTCSEWISLRATEDDSGPIGVPMKVKLTLQSQGHNFDLYVYFDAVRDVVSCDSPAAKSETLGTVDEVIPLTWGEGTVANGSDDSRTIRIAVQSGDGPCPPGSGWTLKAEGHR